MSKQEKEQKPATEEEVPDYTEDNEEAKANPVQGNKPLTNLAYQNSWKDFMLKEEILRSINVAGFQNPSPVQNQCLIHANNGQDILCQAKAGTGKTAVFVLSILNQMNEEAGPYQALVLCHTRELAFQIFKEFERFGKFLKFKFQYVIGKMPIEEQIKQLKSEPPHVLIGTPGRILELAMKNHVNLNKLKFFVLDECDNALSNLQMRDEIQKIFKKTQAKKQVMMFSGTMPEETKKTARLFMKNQMEVIVEDHSQLVLHGLLQYQYNITEKKKVDALLNILKTISYHQVIIFTSAQENGKSSFSSQDRTKYLSKILNEQSFVNIPMFGQLNQEERNKNMQDFKDGKKRILIATDLCSRGLDIPKVNMVINFDMPTSKETYLHRIGRAGRFEVPLTCIISFFILNFLVL